MSHSQYLEELLKPQFDNGDKAPTFQWREISYRVRLEGKVFTLERRRLAKERFKAVRFCNSLKMLLEVFDEQVNP